MSDYRVAALLDPALWGLIGAKAAAIAAAWWLVRRRLRSPPWRTAATALLGVLALRLVLFGNPVAWAAYFSVLNRHIDWRQGSVIKYEALGMMDVKRPVPLLAVGSSQTEVIYGPVFHRDPRLQVYALAGMTPMDMVLYRDRIAALRPCTVLLYLSDFDLATEPRPEWARYAPVPPWAIGGAVAELESALPAPSTAALRRDLLIGWLLPELRYSFVFRALLQRAGGALGIPGLAFDAPLPGELAFAALRARATLPMQPMERLLEDFVAGLGAAGTRVAIVEGGYNPLGSIPALVPKQAGAFAFLEALERRYPFVHVIRHGEMPALTAHDYVDAYHVTPAAADRLSAAAIAAVGGLGCTRQWTSQAAAGGPLSPAEPATPRS